MISPKIGWIAIVSAGLMTSGVTLASSQVNSPSASPPDVSAPSGWPMGCGRMMSSMAVNSEQDYLQQMIPHHQEAIATARRVLQKSDRPEMRDFAQTIITVQQAEIDQMESWLDQWYPNSTAETSYAPMMQDLSQLEGDALDQAFLEDMIMHHREAVMMSQMLLNHNLVEHEAIEPFAQKIATTQRQEIHQMRAWLMDWFGASGGMGGWHGGPGGMPGRPGMGRTP